MNLKLLIRLIVDLLIIILLIPLMVNRITGSLIHEIAGVFLFFILIVHNILNRRWYKTVLLRNNIRGLLIKTVNLLLVITMLSLFSSSIFISHSVFEFLSLEGSINIRQFHVFSAYWGFILMSIHLGMHWVIIMSVARRLAGISGINRTRVFFLRLMVMVIAVYGIMASFDRGIGSRLIMYYSFDVLNADESSIGIMISLISIMGLYISITYYAFKLLQIKQKKCMEPFR